MRKYHLLFTILLFASMARAQNKPLPGGILTGNIMDEKKKALEGASVQAISFKDSLQIRTILSDKQGEFSFANIEMGYYKIRIIYVGMQVLTIDSINFRAERADFNLPDITLKAKSSESLGEVVIYSEKPLVESKDGNITFNAGESALSAGSNASELLTNVPLVTKDPNGKILVRGKEPKILIDDKPVELNLQQLQDLLESLPGSSIEKIEVMTNPPPQYANEQGGVINIVTKKGRVGKSGRISLSAGSRGEASINGGFNYRKQGLSLSINAGTGYNNFSGNGYSSRNNIYTDSSNFFNTINNNSNKSYRPNLRFNMDYDFTKFQSINLVLQYNQNDFHNLSHTQYTNINQFDSIYRLSERNIQSQGDNYSPNATFTYSLKTKIPGETFRIFTGANFSDSKTNRNFYQQFFNPDHSSNGIDSTQRQVTDNKSNGYNVRVDYNRPMNNNKTFLSFGSFYTRSNSQVLVDASYLKKPDNVFLPSDLLSNHFLFHQDIINLRGSVKQILAENFSVTAGASAEQTGIAFELLKQNLNPQNNYWTWLPFANINRTWKDQFNLTLSYRRSIRRPGINELNPTIDFGDPYNIRFGNEKLVASTAHNFDLVMGRTQPLYYINIGAGYNIVQDIFSQVRTLLTDGKTQITWENISGRKEYEVSTWGGLTINKKLRTNLSASYTFNQYSDFDKTFNRYRNGGSFTSNVNSTYTPKDIFNLTGSFTFSRFANPQGYAKWNWSMNVGAQRKFFKKKFVVTVNIIDPIKQQQNRNFTYGSNFYLQSFNTTKTRNYRLTLTYNFNKAPKNPLLNLRK